MPSEAEMKQSLVEVTRWYILVALNAGRPLPVNEDILRLTLEDTSLRLTPNEIRRELDYLAGRKLVELKGEDTEHWSAELTAIGVDVVEYTADCRPGIARPARR